VHCYALRLLNPFLGVVQVVETPSGRASSSNGLVWDVQLLTEGPADWGSLGSGTRGKASYRYGLWSEREGLVSRPLAAQNKDRQLRTESEHLIEQISMNLNRLPFALTDRRELWLLDAELHVAIQIRYYQQSIFWHLVPEENSQAGSPESLSPCNHYAHKHKYCTTIIKSSGTKYWRRSTGGGIYRALFRDGQPRAFLLDEYYPAGIKAKPRRFTK
jgi:hypothetical protein